MNLRSSTVFLAACLVVAGCDSDSSPATGSTSGGDGSTSDDPTNVSVSITATITATSPTTDPTDPGSSTDATSSGAGGSTSSSDTEATGSSDGSSTAGGSGESSSSTTGGMPGTTVYDVQDGTIGVGETVTIEGVVITGLSENIGVFVQEIDGGEHSGVYVDTGDLDLATFSVGDIVDVTGVTTEHEGSNALGDLTGIIAGDGMGMMTATGDSMPLDPEMVDFAVLADPAMAEAWESVLVSVQGDFTAVTFGASFGQFGEFAFESGSDQLLIDNFLYGIFEMENAADFPGFAENATFTGAAGILNYSYGNFKIAPRSAAELTGYMAPTN